MKLHNTRTRQIDSVTPIDNQKFRMYTCGPTVYDHAHIGNLSNYIFADMIRRALQLTEYSVEQAMNYTDVDDKTIRRSQEKYPAAPARGFSLRARLLPEPPSAVLVESAFVSPAYE